MAPGVTPQSDAGDRTSCDREYYRRHDGSNRRGKENQRGSERKTSEQPSCSKDTARSCKDLRGGSFPMSLDEAVDMLERRGSQSSEPRHEASRPSSAVSLPSHLNMAGETTTEQNDPCNGECMERNSNEVSGIDLSASLPSRQSLGEVKNLHTCSDPDLYLLSTNSRSADTKSAYGSPGKSVSTHRSSILSAASSRTPRTPRSPLRFQSYGKPVMPGYRAPIQPSLVIKRTVQVEQMADSDTNLREAIPIMPRAVAIVCFMLNILIPGTGTLVSGLSVLCCSRPKRRQDSKVSVVATNAFVALLQAATVLIFLLGWVWSVIWATTFMDNSREYNRVRQEELRVETTSVQNEDTQTPTVTSNRDNTGRVTTRTTTTTEVSLPGTSSETRDPQHPIIVLQEAPVVVQTEIPNISELVSPERALNPYNPRHQRIMRRRMSSGNFNPMLLHPHAIENIVINNIPVPHREEDEGQPRVPTK